MPELHQCLNEWAGLNVTSRVSVALLPGWRFLALDEEIKKIISNGKRKNE